MGSVKYKPVCYEELKALVESKRRASADIEGKVRQTLHAAKVSRELTLLRQHRQVWSREQARLIETREKAEVELQNFLGQAEMDEGCLSQMLNYELLLESEREEFRTATVKPVWQLVKDLRCRLAELGCDALRHLCQTEEWEPVLQEVESVKVQQAAIVEKLHAEYQKLEQEISVLGIEERLALTHESSRDLELIPDEILHSECPYPDLKAALLHEFTSLSVQYGARLEGVRSRLGDTDRNCGWPAEDHLVFQMVISQYPPDLPQHRALCTDLLQRLIPHRSREELNDHERLWDWYRFTQAQEQAVIRSWRRDRADLLAKTLVTLEESWLAHQQELAAQNDRMRQQEICTHLREKLREWRAQQEEAAQLEATLAVSRREEEEDKLRRKHERETMRRTVQKERIRQHHMEKQRRREELVKQNQERLDRIKSFMAEQARRDRERVQFRAGVLLQRREEREVQERRRLQEEEERQERLESLRSQVAVLAETDPQRMMGDTEASKNRNHVGEEFILQKPLYYLHTYTDTQILSDPRVRIERALREAGLHDTLYAKEVLSSIRPLKPARRDTESTAFRL